MPGRSTRVTPAMLITLGLLAAAAPLSTDLYLSAFPTMAQDLATSATGVQLSLTTFLVGAGAGQVLFGPWSDRAGRMRPLLVGLGVYVLASIAAAIAPSITILVLARFLQGIGGSSGMVIGRAMILDRQSGTEAARALNIMMAMTGIAPIVAPLAGSLLVDPLGWRGILWVVFGIAAISLLTTVCVLRETLPAQERERRRSDRQPGSWRSLLSRPYIGTTVAFAFTMGILMSYISASPFVYQTLIGMDEISYGLAFAVNAIGMSLATISSNRLSRSYSLTRLAIIGLAISLVGTAATLICAGAGLESWPLMLPLFVAVAPLGMVLGNVSAMAMSAVSPRATGLASSLLGLGQFTLAGIAGALVGLGGETTALPMTIIMLTSGIIAVICLAVSRIRAPQREREAVEIS
ncbi:multidrug effflux MFS transporter [Brevibacterium oceani]|uniref:multidrug effflux MFS transporter n=1 Tax=Brevibacterium oceani TaxID=358099 RepID=UPI001B3345DC|nr:multidrug effflux MFS transporter [Brevibacterium oceani]